MLRMQETWTVTPVPENKRSFDGLLSSIGESICKVRPYEQRGDLRGTFDIIVEGKTDEERADIRRKLEHLGLRCTSEQERQVLDQEILLPRQQAAPLSPDNDTTSAPPELPEAPSPTP